MSSLSKPRLDDLKERLGAGSPHFQHDGEDGEDDDLDGGSPRVPVWPTDSVLNIYEYNKLYSKLLKTGCFLFSLYLAGDSGGLEKSGRPGPLGHDGGGRQTDGHFASRVKSRVEIVRVVIDVLPHLQVESLSN